MLQGKKIRIRPLEEEDIEDIYNWYNDQEFNLWASGAWPLNTLKSKEELARKFIDQPDGGHRYAILNEDRAVIGSIGFRDHNVPARSAVIYVNIGPREYWGKGYGTEALIIFVKYLFCQWNLHRLSLDTWDGNVRAIRAYEKAGFKIEGRQREAYYIQGEYHDAVLMGLLKREFSLLQKEQLLHNPKE
ncbi:MAG TPA: GNAT family protein [Desulfitobacteriaceae bacterium]|nr:GNAT family protein [Desulfitobacteriaceae bacterium]